jgi:hypothetical protein
MRAVDKFLFLGLDALINKTLGVCVFFSQKFFITIK